MALGAITSFVWLIAIGPHFARLIPTGVAALPPLLRRGIAAIPLTSQAPAGVMF